LQDEALHDDFDPTKYRTLVKAWINDAQRRIARRIDMRVGEATQSFDTAAGTAEYALPSDFYRLRTLYENTERYLLEEADLRDIDDAETGQGRPYLFVLNGANVLLSPTPDAAYPMRLRYWKSPPLLVGDANVPIIHEDYYDLLVSFARARLFRAEDDPEMAQQYMSEFEDRLSYMAGELQYETRGRPRQVPGLVGRRSGGSGFSLPS
jgi:hypothetical protein